MPHVIMYLPVASTTKVSISARVAVEHGAGPAKRNIVPLTMTLLRANASLQRIPMINAVDRNKVSKKKITVLVVIVRIVRSDGRPRSKSKLHIFHNGMPSLPQ